MQIQVIYEGYQGTYAAVDSGMISKGICRKGHSLSDVIQSLIDT
jgi:hypothetical protein